MRGTTLSDLDGLLSVVSSHQLLLFDPLARSSVHKKETSLSSLSSLISFSLHPNSETKHARSSMTDKDHESLHDMEDEEEARRKKRRKWTIAIIAFLVFQVVQALFFVLVILKFRSPKFRVAPPYMIQTLTVGNTASPSFDMNFVAQIRIKNTNWGPFKYDATAVYFTYQGVVVGQAFIPKGKANFKSTKTIDVGVHLSFNSANSPGNPNLGVGNDLSSGVIALKSQGELRGKVTVMFMFKKKKTSVMDCSMTIHVSRQILSWDCE